MKLWQAERGAYFTITAHPYSPPGAPEVDTTTVYKLLRIDGMYSECLEPAGKLVHILAGAEISLCPNPKEQP